MRVSGFLTRCSGGVTKCRPAKDEMSFKTIDHPLILFLARKLHFCIGVAPVHGFYSLEAL